MIKTKPKKISLTLYSAEKYRKNGDGSIRISIDPAKYDNDADLIKEAIADARKKQKEANRLFKTKYKESLPHIQEVVDKEISTLTNLKSPDGVTLQEITSFRQNIKHSPTVKLLLNKNTGNSTALLGGSYRGKTTLCANLYRNHYDDKKFISILFCKNPQISLYKKFGKDLLISKGFNKKSSALIKAAQMINVKTKNKYKFLIMTDDIIDNKYDKIVNELCMTYRNSDISCILSTQYCKNISPANRANINNIFIFDFNTDTARKDAIELFLEDHFNRLGLKTLAEKLRFFKEVTHDHGFIYINPLSDNISFHRLDLNNK